MNLVAEVADQTPNRSKRSLTAKEVEARRANAKKSTGPRTEKGKQKVRANAIQHGVYAKTCPSITHGPLAENAAEVADFKAAIVAELDAQTLIELTLAQDIADLMWSQRRAQAWRDHALAVVDDPPGPGQPGIPRLDGQLEYLAHFGRLAADTLANLDDLNLGIEALRAAAGLLYDEDRPPAGWDPDRDIPATTAEEWRAAIATLIDHRFAGYPDAVAYATKYADERAHAHARDRAAVMPAAARTALTDGVLERAMSMSGRVRRDLLRMLDAYAELKADA